MNANKSKKREEQWRGSDGSDGGGGGGGGNGQVP